VSLTTASATRNRDPRPATGGGLRSRREGRRDVEGHPKDSLLDRGERQRLSPLTVSRLSLRQEGFEVPDGTPVDEEETF